MLSVMSFIFIFFLSLDYFSMHQFKVRCARGNWFCQYYWQANLYLALFSFPSYGLSFFANGHGRKSFSILFVAIINWIVKVCVDRRENRGPFSRCRLPNGTWQFNHVLPMAPGLARARALDFTSSTSSHFWLTPPSHSWIYSVPGQTFIAIDGRAFLNNIFIFIFLLFYIGLRQGKQSEHC